jgi:signal transduction histidine kinase
MSEAKIASNSEPMEKAAGFCRAARNRAEKYFPLSGRDNPKIENCDIESLLETTANATIENPAVQWEFSIAKDLKKTPVNRKNMRRAFSAIFKNAETYSADGGFIVVAAENFRGGLAQDDHEIELADGDYVKISITGKGPGMHEDVLKNIFDPYFSGGRGTSGNHPGPGLAVAYGTIKKHNGGIRVLSEPGRGTTVTVYLPAA